MVFAVNALLMCFVTVESATLGFGLWRTYTEYVELPTTIAEVKASGEWVEASTTCVPGKGFHWRPTIQDNHHPLSLYLTPAGQISAVQVNGYGNFSNIGVAVDNNYWKDLGNDTAIITASFRAPDQICSMTNSVPDILGDRVVITSNYPTNAYSIPLTLGAANLLGYESGSCFASMGTHAFKDLTQKNMSWVPGNLQPVVPMYDRNNNWALNAIFFTTPLLQQSVGTSGVSDANWWEPIPLPNSYMCKNWCNEQCGWEDTNSWSTFHLYFSDPTKIVCENGCTLGCCENITLTSEDDSNASSRQNPSFWKFVVGAVLWLESLSLFFFSSI